MNEQEQQIIEQIIFLEKERVSCDSKTREREVIDELGKLDLEQFNGRLVKVLAGEKERVGRIWHLYYGRYEVYFNTRNHYKWTSNYKSLDLSEIIEWIDEPDYSSIIQEREENSSKIYDLQEEIDELERRNSALVKDVIFKVDPKSFNETEKIDRTAFSLSGDPVCLSVAFCQITDEAIYS